MAKKAARAKTPKPSKPRPKDVALPGMENLRIPALEAVGREYADIRDDRMELTRRESEVKEKALRLMKQYGKTVYRRNGLEIRLVTGEDDIKVKVKAPKDDEDGPGADEGADQVSIQG